MIEIYKIKESGYHPFLIREGWQIAQLNFLEEQRINNIKKVEVHHQIQYLHHKLYFKMLKLQYLNNIQKERIASMLYSHLYHTRKTLFLHLF